MLLAIAGIALLAFAATRIYGGDEESSTPLLLEDGGTAPSQSTPQSPTPTQPEKAPTSKPATEPGSKGAGSTGSKSPTAPTGGVAVPGDAKSNAEPKGEEAATPQPKDGEKVVETKRFSLIVPNGWSKRESDVGYLLAPRGAAPVSIWIFFERDPQMGPKTMVRKTSKFLSSRSPGGAVGNPKRLSVGGDPAFTLRDRGQDGAQTALGVLAGPYRYLVIESVESGTSDAMRNASARALRTFRPR